MCVGSDVIHILLMIFYLPAISLVVFFFLYRGDSMKIIPCCIMVTNLLNSGKNSSDGGGSAYVWR